MDLGRGIRLTEGGSEALVEARLKALDWPYDGDVRHMGFVRRGQARRRVRALRVVAEQLGGADGAYDPYYDEPHKTHERNVEAHRGDIFSPGVVRRRATHAL